MANEKEPYVLIGLYESLYLEKYGRKPKLNKFREKFIKKIENDYLEKDCYICYNKVPMEGVVVRIEGLTIEAYKHKSFLFKQFESKQLDKGEIDIEENQ